MMMNQISSQDSEATPPVVVEEGTAGNRDEVEGRVRKSERLPGKGRQRGVKGRREAA